MFVRIKKSGNNQYLQVVENRKVAGKVVQRVISTIGRLDRLNEKGDIETLVRSLARYSEKVLLVLSGKSEAGAGRNTKLMCSRSAVRWTSKQR